MADEATSSYGIKIFLSADAASAPTIGDVDIDANIIGQVVDAKLGGIDVKEINKTHLNQSGTAMRSGPGMHDPGNLTVKIYRNGDKVSALKTMAKNRTYKWCLIQIPADDDITHLDSYQMRVWVKSLDESDMPTEGGEMTSDVTLRISGDITETLYA